MLVRPGRSEDAAAFADIHVRTWHGSVSRATRPGRGRRAGWELGGGRKEDEPLGVRVVEVRYRLRPA